MKVSHSEGIANDAVPELLERPRQPFCAESTEQPGRRLLHLVNYREGVPIKDVAVTLQLPPGRNAKQVTLVNPERAADVPVLFKQESETVAFTVSEVAVYEIAVISERG